MTHPRAIAAATIGNIVEWYDFALYSAATPLVFQRLFFARHDDGLLAQLAPMLVFGAGFLVRPAGGILFGLLGDRLGHARALRHTLTIIGLATAAIGLLPGQATIGILAPILLLVLRLAQGFAAGGEWAGAVLLLGADTPGAPHRGVAFALTQSGVAAGMVLGGAALWAARLLPDAAFLSWGWRLPFLAALPFLCLGLWLRATPQPGRPATRHPRPPLSPRQAGPALLRGIVLRLAENGGVYMMLVFGLAYGRAHHVPDRWLLLASTLGMVADGIAMPAFGWLAQRLGARIVYALGAVGLALFSGPFLALVASGSQAGVVMAFIVGMALCHAPMIAVEPALLSALFPAAHRYLGVALAHEAGAMLAGGVSPVVATLLVHSAGGKGAVAAYMGALAGLSLLALLPRPARRAVFPQAEE
ncbi:MFS transporter [Gluconacetobacter sacchari]|uniref:MFS transporter n=1 Tax=Gluconacetobacter sacchari TaxID=92759 RepID=UPI0039B3664C